MGQIYPIFKRHLFIVIADNERYKYIDFILNLEINFYFIEDAVSDIFVLIMQHVVKPFQINFISTAILK